MTGTTLDPTGEPWTPIRIETSEGKQEYAAHQRRFAERAAPLRARLIEDCERLTVGATGSYRHPLDPPPSTASVSSKS